MDRVITLEKFKRCSIKIGLQIVYSKILKFHTCKNKQKVQGKYKIPHPKKFGIYDLIWGLNLWALLSNKASQTQT